MRPGEACKSLCRMRPNRVDHMQASAWLGGYYCGYSRRKLINGVFDAHPIEEGSLTGIATSF